MENNNKSDKWLCCSFAESKAGAGLLLAGYAALLLIALVLGLLTGIEPGVSVLVTLGRIAALVGFTIIAVQVILGSRLKILDSAFGLDKVVIFHRRMGIVAAGLLLIHPVLIAAGKKSFALFNIHTSLEVNLGKVALLLLIAGVFLALFFAQFRLDYNVWRLFHKAMIIVAVLGFAHSIDIGSAFHSIGTQVYWCALGAIAAAAFCRQNFVVAPFGRKSFVVKSVTQQTPDTFTLRLEPEKGEIFVYQPGQFMFLELLRTGPVTEEHPFTISSSPTEKGYITATVKKSGNYTNKIDQTKAGDKAKIQAPFGRFSWVFNKPNDCIFIAGGVGITPIRSMITALCDSGDKRNAVILYANKTEQDIIFRSQLDKLPANFKVVHVLSRAGQDWRGIRGHISADIIKNAVGKLLDNADVYLCGPPAMMKSIIAVMRTLGVNNKKIHYERFTI